MSALQSTFLQDAEKFFNGAKESEGDIAGRMAWLPQIKNLWDLCYNIP
jgi:hypothetical protein